jgi:hypothetical protein
MDELDRDLINAVSAGRLARVQRLCDDQGANPAGVSVINFPHGVALALAVEKGQSEIARYLAAHERMNLKAVSHAIGTAAAQGVLDLVEVFCDRGGDVRFEEDVAIRKACENGQ